MMLVANHSSLVRHAKPCNYFPPSEPSQKLCYLTNMGESLDLELGEYQAPIHFHVEDASAATDQFDFTIVCINLGRHTVRFRSVVSGRTVADSNLHHSISDWGRGFIFL